MKDGDILTNENGMTCIYGNDKQLPELENVDICGQIIGTEHIDEYIHNHNLKVTGNIEDY